MECSRSLHCSLLCLEMVALLMFISCIVLQKYTGGTFNTSDVAFITCVLIICVIILSLTIFFYVTSSSGCEKSIRKQKQTVTKEGISRKLIPMHTECDDFECPICLTKTKFSLSQLSCKHNYHDQCIREWFSTSSDFRCPECRQECKDQSKKTWKLLSFFNWKLRDDMYSLAPSENI